MDILYPVIILAGLALLFSVAIVFVNKKLAVKENEKVGAVVKLLANANCGACGKAGCADFAKALVEGTAKLSDCNPTSKANKEEIKKIIGLNGDVGEELTAVNACNGGIACEDKYEYQGYGDCSSIELLAGGRKSCPSGCIGYGTCVRVCAYHAIDLKEGVAVIDNTKCVSCGQCVAHCPKKIIKLIPKKAVYYIACSNCDKGKEVRNNCKNGCIGCGICVKNCPAGALTLVNNLPVFDYEKCTSCGICAAKCPSKVILKKSV